MSKDTKINKSFRVFLILIVILTSLTPVALISMYLVSEINSITKESALDKLRLTAKNTVKNLTHEMSLTMTRLSVLASNPTMEKATKKSPFGIRTAASVLSLMKSAFPPIN